jgi:hypothetical protein
MNAHMSMCRNHGVAKSQVVDSQPITYFEFRKQAASKELAAARATEAELRHKMQEMASQISRLEAMNR